MSPGISSFEGKYLCCFAGEEGRKQQFIAIPVSSASFSPVRAGQASLVAAACSAQNPAFKRRYKYF